MNFKKNGGFTLVELIVVIAILGILAGIGIPAYGKYVEKTQVAVEEQNINMFHNAFVVACVGNSEDPATYPISINWDSTGTIFMGLNEVTSFSLADEGSTVEGDFNAFFGFPTTTYEFKKLSSKVENGIRNGIDAEGGSTPVYDGGKYTSAFEAVKDQIAGSVSTFQNSNFNKVGATALMGKVDTVTGIASEIFKAGGALSSGLVNSVMADPSGLYAYFGLTGENATMENLMTEMSELTQQENADLMANYAVLQAAKNTTSTQASQWLTELKTNATTDSSLFNASDIKGMMSGSDAATSQEGMSQAAMIYAMYTAYAQTLEGDAKAAAEANTNDIGTFVSNVNNDAGFRTYLQSDAATADMNGYLAALDIINKSTANNTEATKDLLSNGYSDGNLAYALEGLLGNATN